MFKKKAQSQIITTVLIILLVLAAIVIVWQVVQGTVQQGADEISGQSDCFTVGLEIKEAVPSLPGFCSPVDKAEDQCTGNDDTWTPREPSYVVVKRTPGGGTLNEIKVLVNDVLIDDFLADELTELETLELDVDYEFEEENDDGDFVIEVAAIVGDNNKLCGIADSLTVAAF